MDIAKLKIQDLATYYSLSQILVDDILRVARMNNREPQRGDLEEINSKKELLYTEIKKRIKEIK